jgi:hypothetical protein
MQDVKMTVWSTYEYKLAEQLRDITAVGHSTVDEPVLFRTQKLKTVGPHEYMAAGAPWKMNRVLTAFLVHVICRRRWGTWFFFIYCNFGPCVLKT